MLFLTDLWKYEVSSLKYTKNRRNRVGNSEEPCIQSETQDLVFCLLSLVLETRFFSKQVNFERSYLHCLKEFGDVHGHFEYVQEHIFRSAMFLSKFIRSKTPSDQENRCQVSNFHQNRVHHRKKTKIGWTFHPTLKLLKHRRETSYPPNISIFQGHRARSSG